MAAVAVAMYTDVKFISPIREHHPLVQELTASIQVLQQSGREGRLVEVCKPRDVHPL